MSDAATTLPPRAKRNLTLLWLGQFVSGVGDQFFLLAGNMLVLALALQQGSDGAAAKTGLMGAMRAAPALLLGVFAGVLADRLDRRKLMISADAARALILGTLWLAWWHGHLQWWMLPVAAFGCYSFSAVFEPARDSLIPRLAEGTPLLRVNSLFQMSIHGAVIAGCIAAAVMGIPTDEGDGQPAWHTTDEQTLTTLIGIDGLTFLASAAVIMAIRVPPRATTAVVARPSALADLKEIAALVWRDTRLRALLFLTAVNNLFIMGPATVGAALLFQRERGGDFLFEFAIFELGMAAGFLLGTGWILRWGKSWPKGRLVLAGMVMDGLTYVPFVMFGTQTPFWMLMAAIVVHGFFIPWITVARTSIVQTYYPGEIHGRIFSFIGLTVTGFMSLSAALTGIAGEWLSAPWLFFIAGSGGALVGFIGLAWFRTLRRTV